MHPPISRTSPRERPAAASQPCRFPVRVPVPPSGRRPERGTPHRDSCRPFPMRYTAQRVAGCDADRRS